MKVLLTGATGFLGFRTLESLSNNNKITKVIATGRTLRPTHQVESHKVDYILGDLTNSEFVESIVKDVDTIVHTAALSSPWGAYQQFHDANIVPQQNLLEMAKKYNIRKFIYISSPSMYFEFSNKFNIKESDPLPKVFINHYAKTKREAEILLEESGIPFISLRPRALIGRGDTVIMPRLIRAHEEGRLKIIGNGKNIVDLTSVANVVDAILLSIFSSKDANNHIYNISNDSPVKLWEKIDSVLNKLDKKLSSQKVPFWVVKNIATMMETKSKLTNMKEPALTVYGVGTLTKSFTMDVTKAKKLLGYNPKTTVDQSIDEFVKWYKENEKN